MSRKAMIALLFWAQLGATALAKDPEQELDHYLCWEITPTEFAGPKNLSLKDQFDPDKFVPATVESRSFLCNPTVKLVKYDPDNPQFPQPLHANAHLVLYSIDQKDVSKKLNLVNQLSDKKTQTYTAVQQRFLALPSGKKIAKGNPPKDKLPAPPPSIPTDIGHYKCYLFADLTKLPDIEGKWLLRDQLSPSEGIEITKLGPRFICNPVQKKVDDKEPTKKLYENTHLVCYALTSRHSTYSDQVWIANQFEPKGTPVLTVTGPEYLCIPSTKKIVS